MKPNFQMRGKRPEIKQIKNNRNKRKMNMDKKNFIVTTDKDTAMKLKSKGFQIVSEERGRYTFLNNSSKKMSIADNTKIKYTNILAI